VNGPESGENAAGMRESLRQIDESYDSELAASYEKYPRRTCSGGYDYAGHNCEESGCPQ
jgi:hypothetical protein